MDASVVTHSKLFGSSIPQDKETGFLSATDLVKAGNQWRVVNGESFFQLSEWFRRKATIEFIEELTAKYGNVKTVSREQGVCTWVHPLLFIDIALAISPKLKIEVYEWLFDHLIKNRNDSGDSYKEMCGYLYAHHPNKQTFSAFVSKVAFSIKHEIGVPDWESATEAQLNARNQLHRDIALLSDVLRNNNQAIRIALTRFRGEK